MPTQTTLATCSRVLQFRAGPHEMAFAACDRHREDLSRGNVSNFFADPRDEIFPLTEGDDTECDFCRGEDGP